MEKVKDIDNSTLSTLEKDPNTNFITLILNRPQDEDILA